MFGSATRSWSSGTFAKRPALTSVTTFTVEPTAEGKSSNVTITTELALHAGLAGILEGLFGPSMLRNVFEQELRQLATVGEARA